MSITFFHGEHEANFANANAFALMRTLGIEPDYCGEIVGHELASRCLREINRATQRHTRPTEVGHNFIDFGLDAEGIVRRLTALAEIGRAAGNEKVNWG